ncbi:efflux RND transporter permease subunit [Gynuella sp.]|uniref:efflux RND transporter permease subunit n=1 Tax=Gynuella sp. TaxID=2969146 RepID=UPI003D0F4663
MLRWIQEKYDGIVLDNAIWILVLLAVVTAFMGYSARNFELDASPDTLVLEGDPDYRYFREISERYGASSFMFMTYTPQAALFSPESLKELTKLRDELRKIDGIQSVVTVMDVPLLSNPPVPLDQLVSNIKSLEDPETNIEMAKQELANSPLYVNLLLNLDYNTTALQINFPVDEVLSNLQDTRQTLLDKKSDSELSNEDIRQLNQLNILIKERNKLLSKKLGQQIDQIRAIMKKYKDHAELHIGGVPLLADDIVSYVRSDLMVFGLGVLVLLIITLGMIFRRIHWVIVPMAACADVVVIMMGMLGSMHWQVTVISSNFISLLLILTLSMTIHLIVRYRELLKRHPEWEQRAIVSATVRQIFIPCLYMALTTGVAFISLIVSGIRPVINFGLMMTAGILVAFVVAFTFLPAMMMLVGKDEREAKDASNVPFSQWFANLTIRHGTKVLVVSVFVAGMTVIGISRLVVENSFIDYFAEDTEVYQGLSVIDQRLGGTTPLDVLIDFPGSEIVRHKPATESEKNSGDNDGFVDEDFFGSMDDVSDFESDFGGDKDPEKYWFTADKIAVIKQVHSYLDSNPDIGKVLSLATMIEIAESFNNNKPLTDVQLALLYSVIPKEFRKLVIDPYVSVEHGQARFSLRVIDSKKELNRNQLLKQIKKDISEKLGIAPERIHLSGLMVLYNNMLQSLFSSQIKTLGLVFVAIMCMFLVLFRSLKLSLIAMAPNLLAATFVLGIMGWASIPLDIMTITIASITIGMAVDNTIHYIVRFREEFQLDHNYMATLKRSHSTIGRAMFYTSLSIIIGFSILVLSSFRPTIYFGFLTALAMFVALVGSLTLLPQLLILFKPFKSDAVRSVDH